MNKLISTPRTKKSTAHGAWRRLAQLKISNEKKHTSRRVDDKNTIRGARTQKTTTRGARTESSTIRGPRTKKYTAW